MNLADTKVDSSPVVLASRASGPATGTDARDSTFAGRGRCQTGGAVSRPARLFADERAGLFFDLTKAQTL